MEISTPVKIKPSIPYEKRRSRSLNLNKFENQENGRNSSASKQ